MDNTPHRVVDIEKIEPARATHRTLRRMLDEVLSNGGCVGKTFIGRGIRSLEYPYCLICAVED